MLAVAPGVVQGATGASAPGVVQGATGASAPGVVQGATGAPTSGGAPADLVLMAHVKEPFGLTGRLKLHVYSNDLDALGQFKSWWWAGPAGKPDWAQVVPEEFVERGGSVIAKLPGIEDRDAAFARKGWQIAVARSEFSPAADGEYYWSDLVGLRVVNRDAVPLGRVTELMDLGPHQVLRVMQDEREILIPFVVQYVDRVDTTAGEIVVDWGLDY